MSKGFKITITIIFSIISAFALFVGVINLFGFITNSLETKYFLDNSPEIGEYLKNNYDDNLKIVSVEIRSSEYYEISVSDEFEKSNELTSKEFHNISNKIYSIRASEEGTRLGEIFEIKYLLSDNKQVEFYYDMGNLSKIYLNFQITQNDVKVYIY